MNNLKKSLDFIQETKIDEYYFLPYKNVPPNCKEGFVAKVGNNSNPIINIELEINDDAMRKAHFTSVALTIDLDKYYE